MLYKLCSVNQKVKMYYPLLANKSGFWFIYNNYNKNNRFLVYTKCNHGMEMELSSSDIKSVLSTSNVTLSKGYNILPRADWKAGSDMLWLQNWPQLMCV